MIEQDKRDGVINCIGLIKPVMTLEFLDYNQSERRKPDRYSDRLIRIQAKIKLGTDQPR